MRKYKVWLFRDFNGNSPITKFLLKLAVPQQRKVSKQISYLNEFGISIDNPSLKKLSGTTLWELRILGKDNIRILCADTKYGISVLHVFIKKTNKTPKSDISLALNRFKSIT